MASRAPIDWDQSTHDTSGLRPAEKPLPQTGFTENFRATRQEMEIAGNTDSQDNNLREGYAPIIDALEQSGARWGKDQHFLNPASLPDGMTVAYNVGVPGRDEMRRKIFEEVRRRRAADRNFLSELPDTPEEFDRQINARAAERLQGIRRTQAGASTMGTLGGFVGGIAGSFEDPVNVWTMPIGGASKTFLGAVGRAFVENAIVEAITQPFVVRNYAELGEEISLGDSARMILFAGGAGAAFRTGAEGVGRAARGAGPLYDKLVENLFTALPEPLQRRWADSATIGDDLLVDVLRTTMPEEDWTPDLRAAVNVIERDAQIRAASPFEPGPVGDEAHARSLSAALERIVSDAPPIRVQAPAFAPAAVSAPVSRSSAVAAGGGPATVEAELRAAGMPDNVVAGFLGNFDVEAGYGGARGDGGTAFGIAQWRLERVVNFERVIGVHPRQATHSQQAQFVRWEMDNPEAAGMTRAQRDAILAARSPEEAARLIDRYYERSSGEHRERRAQAARQYAGGAPEEPAPAPIAPRGESDADELEALALTREMANASRATDEDVPAVPTLRRDLFPDDESFAAAQRAFGIENDERPIFYHGTNREFDQFELRPTMRLEDGNPVPVQPQAFFFATDREDARTFAYNRAEVDRQLLGLDRGEERVEAVRLKFEQPLDFKISDWDLDEMAERGMDNWRNMAAPSPITAEFVEDLTGWRVETWQDVQRMLDDPDAVAALRADGYDAVRLREDDGSESIAVFDPSQIERVREPSPPPAARAMVANDNLVREEGLEAFSEPNGAGDRLLADSIEHDILADLKLNPTLAAKSFLIEETGEATLGEILDELNGERAAVAALRACL